MVVIMFCFTILLAATASSFATPGDAKTSVVRVPVPTASGIPDLTYAALADRVVASPAIVDAVIRQASRLKPVDAPDIAAGYARFYVVADVLSLIRGPSGIAARVAYLTDVALDIRGKAPTLKKARVLLFARGVAGRAGELQLIAPDAQRPWSAELDARVRGIAREVVDPAAPPAIAGVGNAFHVAGSLPGEGETQIFLNTANGRPVSLSILRRPGEARRWAVALSEVIDESAGAPRPDTLLWYRLACGLPRALPDRAIAAMVEADAVLAREDYGFVLDSLGPCRR